MRRHINGKNKCKQKTTSEQQNEISGESWKNICTEVIFYVDENGCIPYNLFCGLKRRTLKLLDFNVIKQKEKNGKKPRIQKNEM